MLEAGEAEPRQERQRAVAFGGRRLARKLDRQQHVIEDGPPVEQHVALEHDAEPVGRPVERRPATRIDPALTPSSPATSFRSVLLPQPDGPTTLTNSCGWISRSMSGSAGNGPRGGRIGLANLLRET